MRTTHMVRRRVLSKNKNPMNNNQIIFTVEQASEMLQIAPRTLRKAIRENRVKAHKAFNKWYILLEDIEIMVRNS